MLKVNIKNISILTKRKNYNIIFIVDISILKTFVRRSLMRSKDIRAAARKSLGNNIFSSEWLKGLLVMVLFSIVNSAVASLSMGLLNVLLIGPLTFGMYACYLSLARKRQTDVTSTLFSGFDKDFLNSVGTSLLINLAVSFGYFFFIIPGIVIQYMLSMTFYIRADHPEYSITEAMGKSASLMKGNKWRLFKLHFSFIGWHFVGMLTFGIAYFWTIPYMQTAEAMFYRTLVDIHASDSILTAGGVNVDSASYVVRTNNVRVAETKPVPPPIERVNTDTPRSRRTTKD